VRAVGAAASLLVLGLWLAAAPGVGAQPAPGGEAGAPTAQVAARADGELTLFLAGDTILPLPWSQDSDPSFLSVVEEIRGADVAAVSLELTLHAYQAHAQADSGGGWVSGPPEIAQELAWAGVDMLATANNHSFDWGPIGVVETINNLARAGLRSAGTGKDLQGARAPAYFEHPDGKVALVATGSSFTPYGKASRSRPDLHGRPGLNGLAIEGRRYVELPPSLASSVWGAAELVGLPARRLDDTWFELAGLRFRVGDGIALRQGKRMDPRDLAANVAAVEAASATADLVIFSIHAHVQGRWLTELAHRVIDAGADVVLVHGPHEMRGIEIHAGAPIFYSLGDFVFQPELAELFPAETYERLGLDDSATPDDVRRAREEGGKWNIREPFESVAAVVRFRAGAVREIRLLPLDLGMAQPMGVRGKPRWADPEMGRYLIGYIGERSKPYGTGIRYVEQENIGLMELGAESGPALSSSALR
jgi:poly-gamma-glutamate synthesis protein (capsule biosynthesis protein)